MSPGEGWVECDGSLINSSSTEANLPILPTADKMVGVNLRMEYGSSQAYSSGSILILPSYPSSATTPYLYKISSNTITSLSNCSGYSCCSLGNYFYLCSYDYIYKINPVNGNVINKTSVNFSNGAAGIFSFPEFNYIVAVGGSGNSGSNCALFSVNSSGNLTLKYSSYEMSNPFPPLSDTSKIVFKIKNSIFGCGRGYIRRLDVIPNSTVIYPNQSTGLSYLIANDGTPEFFHSENFLLTYYMCRTYDINTGIIRSTMFNNDPSYSFYDSSSRRVFGDVAFVSTKGNSYSNGRKYGEEYLYSIIDNHLTYFSHSFSNSVNNILDIFDFGNNIIFYKDSNNVYYQFTNFTKKLLPYRPGHYIKLY